MREVVLYPGSFNPLHMGHLVVAEALADRVGEVWLVPSPQNPFKVSKQLLPDRLRLEMARLSVADNPRIDVCDIEMQLPRPSYTINTVLTLEAQHPDVHFSLAMGGDNLESFQRWYRFEELLQHCPLLVYPRPGSVEATGADVRLQHFPSGQPLPAGAEVWLLDVPMIDISSTLVRQRLAQQRSIRYLVPEAVRQLLEHNE